MNCNTNRDRRDHPFHTVRRDLDQWFEQIFGQPTEGATVTRRWNTPAAVWEDEGHVYVEVELAGVAHEDVDVTIEKGVLNIVADRKQPEDDRNYLHHSRRYGKTEFAAKLPDTIDGENVEAELKYGVLLVTLNKIPAAKPKKVTVKSSD